jgi:hypothetical protein
MKLELQNKLEYYSKLSRRQRLYVLFQLFALQYDLNIIKIDSYSEDLTKLIFFILTELKKYDLVKKNNDFFLVKKKFI